MKIVDALITEIRENVTTRDLLNGASATGSESQSPHLALMHGKITVMALGILEDGRCVKFQVLPENLDKVLAVWNTALIGREIHYAPIAEEADAPQEIDLGI